MTADDVNAGASRPGTLPTDVEPTFEAPWQARSFAIAVALSEYHEGEYSWREFQERLVGEIETADAEESDATEAEYYERWLRALERLLIEEEFVDADRIRERVADFAAGDRDASEFVDGEHDHADGHDHEHDHGHDHQHDHANSHDHQHDHDHDHQHDQADGHDHAGRTDPQRADPSSTGDGERGDP